MKSRSVQTHLVVVLSSLLSFVLSLTNALAIDSAESRTFLKLTVDLGCGAELFSNLEAAGQKISQDPVCPADVT